MVLHLFGSIDLQGQKLAMTLNHIILSSFAVLAIFVAFYTDSVTNLWMTVLLGIATDVLVVCPSWGFYKRNQLKFLEKVELLADKKKRK